MKLQKADTKIDEVTLPLSSINPGDVFRFAHDSFGDALKSDLFYMRIEAPELKESALIVNLQDGKRLVRDAIHRVIKHEVSLSIVR